MFENHEVHSVYLSFFDQDMIHVHLIINYIQTEEFFINRKKGKGKEFFRKGTEIEIEINDIDDELKLKGLEIKPLP